MKGDVLVDATVRGQLDDPSRLSIEGTATISGLEYADASITQPIASIEGTLEELKRTGEVDAEEDIGVAMAAEPAVARPLPLHCPMNEGVGATYQFAGGGFIAELAGHATFDLVAEISSLSAGAEVIASTAALAPQDSAKRRRER